MLVLWNACPLKWERSQCICSRGCTPVWDLPGADDKEAPSPWTCWAVLKASQKANLVCNNIFLLFEESTDCPPCFTDMMDV